MGKRPPIPLAERFWAKVEKSDGCWAWTGARYWNGYGQIRRGGQDRRYLTAHRVAWELAYGPIPRDMDVLHRCDNRPCCRPDHLFLGTDADNAADKVAKGRQGRAFGNFNAATSYTMQDVANMRAFARNGVPKPEIEARYKICRNYLNDILSGRRWKERAV